MICRMLHTYLIAGTLLLMGNTKATPVPPAPIPPAIAAAKTIFLSNMCEQSYNTCSATYNALYAGLQTAGKYQLVLDPAKAELIFELHYTTRIGGVSGSQGSTYSSDGTRIHLLIVDRATRVALWSVNADESGKDNPVTAILFDLSIITKPNAVAGPEQTVPGFKH